MKKIGINLLKGVIFTPYKSLAQMRKFHAMEKRGEISHATVAHWDKASKGMHLPERLKRKPRNPHGIGY